MPKGEYLQYGGQAIIEGVMMRSPKYFAVACRAPNGRIVLQTEPLEKSWIGRQKWLKIAFLRGTLAIVDAMALGYKALRFAADIQLKPEYMTDEQRQKYEEELAAKQAKRKSVGAADASNNGESKKPDGGDTISSISVGFALFAGLALGLFIFVFLPNLIAEWIPSTTATQKNIVSGIFKVVFFLGYIWLISFAPDIRRVFQYHGAEHKAINVLEADQELHLDTALKQTRLHPRCGTSFAIIVLLISLVAFTFVPRYPLGDGMPAVVNAGVRFGIELVILPLIAGVSYELLRLAGRMKNKALMTALFWPGLMTQYLTTREPFDDQAEVAVVSLRAVVHAEESGEVVSDAARFQDGIMPIDQAEAAPSAS